MSAEICTEDGLSLEPALTWSLTTATFARCNWVVTPCTGIERWNRNDEFVPVIDLLDKTMNSRYQSLKEQDQKRIERAKKWHKLRPAVRFDIH